MKYVTGELMMAFILMLNVDGKISFSGRSRTGRKRFYGLHGQAVDPEGRYVAQKMAA